MMTAMERKQLRESQKIRGGVAEVAKMKAPAEDEKATVAVLAERVDAMRERLNEVIDTLRVANVLK